MFYKANLHCHTTVSDGRLTPEEVKTAYKNEGYSIVAYTDHNVLVSHQNLTDDCFLALNGMELDVSEGENGIEKSEYNKTCHICFVALSPDNLEVKDTDGYVRIKVTDKNGKRANTNAYFTDELFTE